MPKPAVSKTELFAAFQRLRPEHASDRATHRALSIRYGLSHNTIRKYCGEMKRQQTPPAPQDAPQQAVAPLPSTTTPFPDKKRPTRDYAHVIDEIRRVQAYKAATSVSQRDATWIPQPQYPTLPIAVLWCCDLHIGSWQTDYDFLDKHLHIVETTPNFYVAFGGDHIDGFSPASHPSAMMGDAVTPDDQFGAWADKLGKLDRMQKVAAMVWGNHDLFSQMSGIDPFSSFFRAVSCPLFVQGGGVLTTHVGRERYRLGMRHTYWGNSKLNATNAPKRMIGYWKPNLDAALVGHTHVAGGESYTLAGEDKIAVSGGTYKMLDSFHMQWGDDPHPAGFTLLLYPDNHRMQLCRYPEDAADILLGKIARLPHEREPKIVEFVDETKQKRAA